MKIIRVFVATLVTMSALPAAAPPAAAAGCRGQFRYASSTNTIYLSSGTATLSAIHAACPKAPLAPVRKGVWRLDADLVIANGATLLLKGRAAGGDVDTLLLRSSASNRKTEVSAITAKYGTIHIEKVSITSWDPARGRPDTDPRVPHNAPKDARGRAFIRVISYLDGSTPRESRMDIIDSDLGHLGFKQSESYGVSYKARGCDADHLRVCDALNVYGKQINSRFHHNYFGVYTFNAYGMTFRGNEYDHNIEYGLDPHDDSDHLTIVGNKFHDNGNHGLICSKRCDHLLIAKNVSYRNGLARSHNGKKPAVVTGIMLHSGVTDAVVEHNVVRDHPNGSGIAVFDSVGNVIRNNEITNARYGLRYSVGTRDTKTIGNVVRNSGRYAVFTYRGTDRPVHSGNSGRPANLLFRDNTFDGAGGNIVRVSDSDGVRFVGNTFTGSMRPARMDNSTRTTFVRNTGPSSLVHATYGTSRHRSSTVFERSAGPVRVRVDDHASAVFTNADGTVYRGSTATSLTPSGGTLVLTSARIGTKPVTVAPAKVTAVPASGRITAEVTESAGDALTMRVSARSKVQVRYTVGGLKPGKSYTVTRGGTTIKVTADSSGTIAFRDTLGSGTAEYRISAR